MVKTKYIINTKVHMMSIRIITHGREVIRGAGVCPSEEFREGEGEEEDGDLTFGPDCSPPSSFCP